MIPEFQRLNDHEVDFMFRAPLMVCILIAGADGKIDRKEINEAIAVTQKRNHVSAALASYFDVMSQDFEDKMKILIQSYPYESTQRTPLLIQELSELNALWPKLSKEFSSAFYRMLLSLAERVASSSGGLLGIRAVGAEEARFLKLPMIEDPSKK